MVSMIDLEEIKLRNERNAAIRKTLRSIFLAEIQSLSPEDLIVKLDKIWEEPGSTEILERLKAIRLNAGQKRMLANKLSGLAVASETLPTRDRQRIDRILANLLKHLSAREALAITKPFLDHRRKSRREVAYSVIRWAGMDREAANKLLSQHEITGDERLLKIIVASKEIVHQMDVESLLKTFSDRYWQMRVFEALLATNNEVPLYLIERYSSEFVQAVGRLRHTSSISLLKRLFRKFRSNPQFLSLYAWALLQFEEYEEVRALWSTLTRYHQPELQDILYGENESGDQGR